MIDVRNVTKRYKTAAGNVEALAEASINVSPGEFIMITGRSGAGKSTLLGVMGGLLRPTSGQTLLEGQPLWQLSDRARAEVRAERIGFVFQNAPVISSLTVLDNVILPQMFLRRGRFSDGRRRALELLEMVRLTEKAQVYPDQLSGGEKRRVAIASAMMNEPDILLADEPTGDLDSETEARIIDCFSSLKSAGATIVMVSHNRQLARSADRMFEMDNGGIEQVLSRRDATGEGPVVLDWFRRPEGKATAS